MIQMDHRIVRSPPLPRRCQCRPRLNEHRWRSRHPPKRTAIVMLHSHSSLHSTHISMTHIPSPPSSPNTPPISLPLRSFTAPNPAPSSSSQCPLQNSSNCNCRASTAKRFKCVHDPQRQSQSRRGGGRGGGWSIMDRLQSKCNQSLLLQNVERGSRVMTGEERQSLLQHGIDGAIIEMWPSSE